MKIIAFAATNSKNSINQKLVRYASTLVTGADVEVLDINDYEMPLFGEDIEKEIGVPDLAERFLEKIKMSDAIIISFAEHNGSYSVAYKNLFDWCTRVNHKVYQKKPMILLSTSPGAFGGASVLASAVDSMKYFDGIVKGSFSLPKFEENFNLDNQTISNPELDSQLKEVMGKLTES